MSRNLAMMMGLIIQVIPVVSWSTEPEPSALRSRFTALVQSPELGLVLQLRGGVVVQRPGRLRMELFHELGHSVLRVTADQGQMGLHLLAERRHLHAAEADAVMFEVTQGTLGIDGMLGVLLGQVPLSHWALQESASEGAVDVWRGGGALVQVTTLDGRPHQVEVRRDGRMTLGWTYASWEDIGGTAVPTKGTMLLPELDLTVDIRFRKWESWHPGPDVFSASASDGFTSTPLEEAMADVWMRALEQ